MSRAKKEAGNSGCYEERCDQFLLNGFWGLFLQGVKWPWHDINHPPTSNAKVQNEWNYSPTCFNGMDTSNFTFTFVTYDV
jgi:hypothetical protein